jgi:hypothetical protein
VKYLCSSHILRNYNERPILKYRSLHCTFTKRSFELRSSRHGWRYPECFRLIQLSLSLSGSLLEKSTQSSLLL